MINDKLVNKTKPSGIIPTTPATVLTMALAKSFGKALRCEKNNTIPTGIITTLKTLITFSIESFISEEALFLFFAL